MEFEIREYRAGDETGILESFNRVFREVCGEGYRDRQRAFWDWQFARNPAGHRIVVAVRDDGTVLAQYAGVPQTFDSRYGDAVFVHIVDSFVVPEARSGLKRPGLFVTTAYPWFELCDRMGDAVLYGYPVATAERIGQRYLEYKPLRDIDYLCRDVGVAGAPPTPAAVEVDAVAAVPAETDALFAELASERGCLVRRDRAYLDWRYRQVPGGDGDYLVLAARRSGALRGLAVLRPQHELVPGACTIADWVVPGVDAEIADALLARAAGIAAERQRQRLLAVFAPDSPEAAALRSRGFETVPSSAYMTRRLTHRIYHPEMTTGWLAEHWWYTLGDSDLV
ncbi:MAG: hypothetical protein IPM29_12085 [Planctomycetes bacterium]|nr:hypothetical protein [Planctomycetota bacterium]